MKKIICLGIVTFIILMTSVSALAVVLDPDAYDECGYFPGTPKIYVEYYINPTFATSYSSVASKVQPAVTSWNNSNTAISLYSTSQLYGPNYVYFSYMSNSDPNYFGECHVYSYSIMGPEIDYSYVYMNVSNSKITAPSSSYANYPLSTMCHELGHAIGLGHTQLTSEKYISLMCTARDRNAIYFPVYTDIRHVHNLYY